jgi:hypothetical protein
MELIGKVVLIGATELKGAKEFKIRQIVIQTDEQYPQSIPVQFVQDKCSVLDNYVVGDLVKIGINIKGAEWQGRYFANIQGWKIDKTDSTSLTPENHMPDREAVNHNEPSVSDDEEDDLPF